MKQLIINGSKAHFFFNEEIENSKIAIWVNDNLSRFRLNEEWNCDVSLVTSNTIMIRGDEDRMHIEIKQIESLL
jgi:hypothetical protein